MANTSNLPVLPASYFYFFFLVEPILTLAGAVYAIFLPTTYGGALLPSTMETASSVIGSSVRGRLLVGCLGNCFFLLAMLSLSLFPIIKKDMEHLPALQEKVIRGLLTPLAIADVTHIILSLLPLPRSLIFRPDLWTGLTWGNVGITAVLFLVRSMWFLKVGRGSPALKQSK